MSASPNKPLSIVARRLREAREEAGLSQRQLGIDAGWEPSVASPRINQYERGKHTPDIQTLSRLGDLLNRPLAFFYAEDDGLAALVMAYHRQGATRKKRLLAFALEGDK